MKFKYKVVLIALFVLLALCACAQTDVVGNTAKTSFEKLVNAMPEQVVEDTDYFGWAINAPDQTARFVYSKDYSQSTGYDILIEVDMQPFVDAGLDITKLPKENVSKDKLIFGTKLGEDKVIYKGVADPISSFNKLVELYRPMIGYHETLDHYGVDLGNGNTFEWAKDRDTNDKDLVFVVDPKLLIQAGVNPDQVDGWKYASVQIKDKSGKNVEVMKFLKPFNIE